ncbi:hypothetical protein [Ruania halotolerans]|uniref:hypothetical protein n=1 Tax=Ruania halotolerans TaxID=2897773 RepID=UPI001E62AC9A|nr:hypothetical protein [Ruania halotolerans]UFU05510.1 hypothetical protein LQF10_13785 [Ruania halotolerans]
MTERDDMTEPDGVPAPLTPDRPMRTDDDLLDWARFVHGDGRPLRSTLWVLVLDADDLPLPVLLPIDDLPDLPDDWVVRGLMESLSEMVREFAPGGSVALLLERPGPSWRRPQDRAWDAQTRAAARQVQVRVRAFVVAGSGSVLAMTLDDAA